RARNDIRDAIATLQQLPFIKRGQQTLRESGGKKCGPEAIAGPREVMAHRGRVESRIDAAKEYAQIRRDHVANRFLSGRAELFFGWFPGLAHVRLKRRRNEFVGKCSVWKPDRSK